MVKITELTKVNLTYRINAVTNYEAGLRLLILNICYSIVTVERINKML